MTSGQKKMLREGALKYSLRISYHILFSGDVKINFFPVNTRGDMTFNTGDVTFNVGDLTFIVAMPCYRDKKTSVNTRAALFKFRL